MANTDFWLPALLVRMDIHYSAPSGTNSLELYHLTAGLAWRF